MFVAGEASGDSHGAHLISALRALDPKINFTGLGGPQMQSAGLVLYEDLTKFAVVGFSEVLKHYSEFKRIFDQFVTRVEQLKPDAVVLIDYPGFNLRLAKVLKEKGFKVIYYISPQVWAWKENRVKLIQKYVDKMLVLFPFEKKFYTKHGLDVELVGHPLVDTVKATITKDDLLPSLGLDPNKLTIGLLPGSREKEVEKLLPVMAETAKQLYKEYPNMQFLVMKAPTISFHFLKSHLEGTKELPLRIVPDRAYDGINACDVCIVASGTATLETAILKKPMVVVYKTSLITYFLAKSFIKIPYIGLVNVVAGKKIVPECIQNEATPENIAREIKNIFTDEVKIADIKAELGKVKESLGQPGASERAARKILEIIRD